MNLLFFNTNERLRSGWRFLIFAFIFLLLITFVEGLLFLLLKNSNQETSDFFRSNWGFLIQNSLTLVVALAVGWFCQRFIEELHFKTLGWTFQTSWLRDLLFGIAFGVFALLIAVGIAAAGGSIKFQFNSGPESSELLQSFSVSAIVFLLGSAAEETLFRGYAFQTFSRARLVWLAVLLTSIPFALVHLGNPNVVPGFTFINTALAGVWLGAAYLKTRNLWFPVGVHFAWNWTMNGFFGIPVSGITSIAPAPILNSIPVDSNLTWLSGGDYGIEGGAACTAALLISTLIIWFTPFLKPDEELLLLTSRENPVSNNRTSV